MALAAHPALVADESLKRPDESKLSSARFLLSPLVVLRTPALICDQRAAGAWLGAESDVTDCDSRQDWSSMIKPHNYKSLLLYGRRCRANSKTDEGNATIYIC